MIAKPPAKNSEAVPGNVPEKTFKPFQPEMPQIPGVSDGSRHSMQGVTRPDTQRLPEIVGIAIAMVVCAAIGVLWFRSRSRVTTNPSPDTQVVEQPAPPAPDPVVPVHEGPSVAATVEELSKPWAARKFSFVKPITQENVHAMVIRLPDGGLWAFSLQGPFNRCELEYVTDLAALASKYQFTAKHPMVVSPCDNTVYDPLKIDDVGGNTWVRGQIVQGNSLRPPLSIDVQVKGPSIIAERIE
jgi:hypothetical protein